MAKNDLSASLSLGNLFIYGLAYFREGKIQLDAHPISALRLLAGYRSIIRKEYNGAKAKPVSDLYLGASYNVLKNLSVHIHADNLLNKDYQYYYACRL